MKAAAILCGTVVLAIGGLIFPIIWGVQVTGGQDWTMGAFAIWGAADVVVIAASGAWLMWREFERH